MPQRPALDPAELARREPEIEAELRDLVARRWQGDPQPVAAALKDAFVKFFGDRHSYRERAEFFLFVAPRMRRLTIEAGLTGRASGTLNLRAVDLDEWLERLETVDPECARMIDLHYFAGLTTRETAAVLGYPTRAVIRELRFAKAWLQARVRWTRN
ncbi:MAG TPA: ECF-type sigma factor [Steroidobacteraceae bacterium]|jgi:DNA-directed RNA polymerase specialized sigma24 family protein